MTRRWRPALIVAAAAGMLAVGGSIAAFADWATAPATSTLTITASRVPTMEAPRVLLIGRPVVRWDRARLTPAVPVQRYVVTRHRHGSSTVVCDVPALLATCVDLFAPIDRPVSYSVHATFGKWAGAAGGRSGPVTVPRGLAAPSAAVVAKVTAAATVTTQALTATDPATTPRAADAPESASPTAADAEPASPAGQPPTATQPAPSEPDTTQPETSDPQSATAGPQTAGPDPNQPPVTVPDPATGPDGPGAHDKARAGPGVGGAEGDVRGRG